jgi:hypothetical protein
VVALLPVEVTLAKGVARVKTPEKVARTEVQVKGVPEREALVKALEVKERAKVKEVSLARALDQAAQKDPAKMEAVSLVKEWRLQSLKPET